MANNDTFMFAMVWTCKQCGFIYEGGQPKMECPGCESYKTSFIDLPQHIEQQVRAEFTDVPPNHRDARAKRLELMAEHNVDATNSFAGRVLPAASGNSMNPSDDI